MKAKLAVLVLLAAVGPASAGPMPFLTSDWQYQSTFSVAGATGVPPAVAQVMPVGDKGTTWSVGSGQPAAGVYWTLGGGDVSLAIWAQAWSGGWTGLSPGTYLAGLNFVTAYTMADPKTPGYTASGTEKVSGSFTISDMQGHQGTLTYSGTLSTTWAPTGEVSTFRFDGPDPQAGRGMLSIGGINYSVALQFGPPPGQPSWWTGTVLDDQAPYRANVGELYAQVSPTSTLPEPGTLALAGIGVGLAAAVRRLRGGRTQSRENRRPSSADRPGA